MESEFGDAKAAGVVAVGDVVCELAGPVCAGATMPAPKFPVLVDVIEVVLKLELSEALNNIGIVTVEVIGMVPLVVVNTEKENDVDPELVLVDMTGG